MSKRGDWPWAPLSSDLEVYDFFLWGYLKHQIWDTPQNQHPRTLRDIRAAIVRECNNLPPAMISNVFDGMFPEPENVSMLEDTHFLTNNT